MPYFINFILLIGAIQSTSSKKLWPERGFLGLTHFFIGHSIITYMTGRDRDPNFFSEFFRDYIAIFENISYPVFLAFLSGFMVLISFAISNFHK